MNNYEKATQPTIYFIGVTTGKSSIMKVFPRWAKALNLKDAVIKGIDFKPHSDPAAYREAVQFIKDDPLSLGALVTTHKIDVYNSCKDLFDYIILLPHSLEKFPAFPNWTEASVHMPKTLFPAVWLWKPLFRKITGKIMVEKSFS